MVQTARLSRRLWVGRHVAVGGSRADSNVRRIRTLLQRLTRRYLLTGRRYPLVTHFYWVVNEFGDEAAPSRTLRRALQRESRQGLRGVLIPRHREPLRKAASLVRQLNRFACWSIAPSTGRIVKKKTQSQSGECRSCAMDDTQIFAGHLALALLRRIKLSSRNQSRVRATLPPRVICSPAGQSQAQAHPGRRWSPHIVANKVSSRQPGGRGSLCGAMGNGWLGSGPS